MTDSSTALAGVEAVPESQVEEVENTEAEPDTEIESQDDSGEGEGEQEEQPEEIEFDFGGNKLKVLKGSIPPEVAEQLDKFTKGTWSDYTRKSQENAERTKSIEARERAVDKLHSLNGEALQTFSKGLAVRDELEQLRKIDVRALWQSNPDQARQVSDTISAKQAELQNIANTVSQKEQELTKAQETEVSRRMEEGKQIVEKQVKGFKADDVVAYAIKSGISEKEAHTWALSPVVAVMAHKAMLYDRMQTNIKPKPAPKVDVAQPVKAIPQAKGGMAKRSPHDMSVAEMAKHLGLRN